MSARDDLARIVNIGWGSDGEYEALDSTDYAIADAVLAAGYSKPRIVTTVDELEALPVGSVVRGVDEHFVFERYASDAVFTIRPPARRSCSRLVSRNGARWFACTVSS